METQGNESSIFRAILEESNMGIVICDADSLEMLYANPTAISFATVKDENYKGYKCYEYMSGEHQRCKGCMLEQVYQSGYACRSKIEQPSGKSYASELKKMDWNGRKVITSFITDITGIAQEQHELQHSERLLRQAIEDSNLFAWEYSFKEEMLINENRVLRETGYVKNPHNLPETQIEDGYIAQESQSAYRKMFADMRGGAPTVNGEIWMYRNLNPEDKHCISISYTMDFENAGNVISASGLGLDITEQKHVESLHQKQIENLMNTYPDALGSFKMNLTQDYVTSQNRLHSFIEFQGDKLKIDDYLYGMKGNLIEDEFQKYTEFFSRKRMLDIYQNGEQKVSFTHRFKFTDRIRWVKTTAQILANPVSKELEAYVFAVDVSEKILNEQMLQKLINSRYDIIALIYPKEGYVDFRYSGNEFQDIPEISIEEYDRNRLQSSKLFGEGQDQEYMRYTQLDRIIKHLDTEDIYSFTMSRILDGKKCYKRYSYNYLTEDRDSIIATVQDITSLMEKEEAQVKAIQTALAEAERANAAKTAFLSNMSHDIRTPMNAIINMAKMAEEDIHVPEKALEDLKKITVSSEFLLSLINDVLDMAKIDSGKMEFQPEVYEYSDFLNYIDSVFTPLCKNKDINFVWNRVEN